MIAVVILSVPLWLCTQPLQAHVESTLFLEHPPKTAFGVLSQVTRLDVNEDETAVAFVPFVEYAPSSRFSFGLAAPGGWFDGEYLLSDVVVSAKGLFHYRGSPIVPLFSVELPTGEEPATSDHTELLLAVFSEKMTPRYHVYGSAGARATLSEDDDDHGPEEVDVLSPHAEEEVFASLGLTWWLQRDPMLGVDGRITTYYEDFEELAPKFQLGVVFQTKVRDLGYKVSLDGSRTTDGIREGWGLGLSFYVSP